MKYEPTTKLLINNEWVKAKDGATFETIDPATEMPICSVPRGRAADIDAAVQAAHAALSGPWGQMTPFERGRMLNKLADLIERNRERLAYLERIDVGKPVAEALGDMNGVAGCFRYNAGATDKMEGATIPLGQNFVDYTSLEPIGVTGHIVPWNYPLGMAARSLAPALAAGCTAVLKPAEQSPLTALAFGELCIEAGLPAGVVNIVTGYGEEAGDALVRHPLVRGVTFTGSVETGRKVYLTAAAGIKPVVLELGGKNPMIVFEDADIDRVTTDALDASFGNSGQVCSSSSRYLLHKSIKEEFLTQLEKKVAGLTVGMPADNPTLGPLVSKEQYEKVMGYIEQGRRDGAKIRFGGGRPAGLNRGYFVEPTVFANVNMSMRIAREEIFGPVLGVFKWNNEAKMLAEVNQVEYGLTASIWTNDLSTAHRTAMAVEAGFVWINEVGKHFLGAPFGGFKRSGLGREECFEEMLSFTQEKNIHVRLKPVKA